MDKNFIDIELDGIDTKDYPDFVDAYIVNASVEENGAIRQATDDEIDELNNDSSFVYECVIEQLF